jgi:hypothetical protein
MGAMQMLLPRPARTTLAALAVVTALVSTGCGSDPKAGSTDDSPDAQKTQNGTVLRATWPLTGLDANGAAPDYPPLVVKFDNTFASRPQIGLRKADLVTEELVEGGLTRLAAFYETHLPDVVGPVRSMRASDIGVVKPVDATIVTSGAASPTIARLRTAGVSFKENGATGFYRDSGRAAPYNLFVKLTTLAATLKAPKQVPQPYLSWGKEKDFSGGAGAKSIQARFSPGHTTEWRYRNGKYVNTNTNAAAGTDFRPDTVVVVRVKQGNAGYLDPAGNPVPETIYKGGGKAVVFHRGKVVRGSWTKSGPTGALVLKTRAGKLKIPAGHTWIELLPRNGAGGQLSFQG